MCEGQDWKMDQWVLICTGGEMERMMIPKHTPAWTEWKGKEYRHPGRGAPRNWVEIRSKASDEYQLAQIKAKIQELNKEKQMLKARMAEDRENEELAAAMRAKAEKAAAKRAKAEKVEAEKAEASMKKAKNNAMPPMHEDASSSSEDQ